MSSRLSLAGTPAQRADEYRSGMAGLHLARAADQLRARAQHLVHFMPSANQRVVEYIKNRVNKDLGALERQIVEIEKLPSDQLLGRMGDLIKLYREHKARGRARARA